MASDVVTLALGPVRATCVGAVELDGRSVVRERLLGAAPLEFGVLELGTLEVVRELDDGAAELEVGGTLGPLGGTLPDTEAAACGPWCTPLADADAHAEPMRMTAAPMTRHTAAMTRCFTKDLRWAGNDHLRVPPL